MTPWLSKDAKRLLAGYFRLFEDLDDEEAYTYDELRRLLTGWDEWKHVCRYGDTDRLPQQHANDEPLKDAAVRYAAEMNRVKCANKLLEKYGFLKVAPHTTDSSVVVLTLTLDGWEQGRRNSTWLGRSQLWFERNQTHWLWLLAAAIGGALFTKVFDWIFGKK